MTREDAEKYLRLLGQELQKKGVTGEILMYDTIKVLVGIKKPDTRKDIEAYLAGDKTAIYIPQDINGYFGGQSIVLRDTIAQIASDENISINWLDIAAKEVFDTDTDIASKGWLEYPALRIYLALPSHMFAMQVATATNIQDNETIQILAEKLHVLTMQQALSFVRGYIPKKLFTSEMRLGMKQALKLARTKRKVQVK